MNNLCARSVFIALCTLAPGPAALGGDEPSHLITVPWTERPPTIDGTFEEGEWDGAAEATGWLALRTGRLAEKPARVYLAFDEARLYLAIVTEYESTKLQTKVRQNDDSTVCKDDSIEVHLVLPGGRYVQFIGNSIDTHYDALVNGNRYDESFNAHWSFANRTRYKDTEWQVGGVWTAELSVLFADLGVATPAEGSTWRANFCRNWNQTEAERDQRFSTWSPVEGGFHDPANFGVLRFTRQGAVVRLGALGRPTEGDLNLRGRVVCSGSGERAVRLTARVLGADGVELAEMTETVRVTPGRSRDVALDGVVSVDRSTPASLSISARDADSGALRYASRIPLNVRPAFRVDAVPAYLQGFVELRYDASRVASASGPAVLDVSLRGPDDATPLRERRVELDPDGPKRGALRLSLADCGPGKYDVRALLLDKNGETIAQGTDDLALPKPPEWVGHDLGLEPKVPGPWTPVELEGTTVRCWGRTYEFGRSLFPKQIITRGEPLLAAPIDLELRTADGAIDTASGTMVLKRLDDATVEGVWKAGRGPLTLEGRIELQFDGFARFDLTLVPEDAVTIQRMALSIPMLPRRVRDAKGLIKCPPEQPHNVHASFYPEASGPFRYRDNWIYDPGGWAWTDRFVYYVWVGDDWRGLTYTTDSDEHWHTDTYLTVDKAQDAARLTFTVIDRPTKVAGPVTYRFGLQATPLKPLPKKGRRWHVGYRGRPEQLDPHGADARLIEAVTSYGNLRWVGYPEPRDHAAERIAGFHERGVKVVPDYFNQAVAGESPEFRTFGREWEKIPGKNHKTSNRGTFRGVCHVSSYADFYLHGIERLQRFGFDGIYQDVSNIPLCENGLHGCGYTDAEGRRHPTYGVFASRLMYKRQYTIIKNHDPDAVVFHHGIVPSPILAYVDVCTEGESWLPLYRRGHRLSDMSLSHYRAQNMYQERYGVPVLFYAGTVSRGEQLDEIPNLLSLTLLHNQYPDVPSDLRGIQDLIDTWKVMDEWLAESRWVPYWSEDLPVDTPSGRRIHASAWCEPADGRAAAMVVVSNLGPEPWEGEVTLDAANLGMNPDSPWRATDPMTGEPYELERDRLRAAIPARSPIFILIEQP